MSRPGFVEGIGVAVVAALGGGVTYELLNVPFEGELAIRLVIAGEAFGYLLYLFARSHERIGRVTLVTFWLLVTVAGMFLIPSLVAFLVIQVAFIWVVRSLYFYSSLIPAVIDLGFTFLSATAAVWAVLQTGGVFAAVWCFFLVQSFIPLFPLGFGEPSEGKPNNDPEAERFQNAFQVARGAVQELAGIRSHKWRK
ncbi:MAG: hypothetical protein GY703_00550 [Gammaproteobacteria bacterium]|nr:hypothetical protein [Gammaproteobacteria bacterium]